MNMYYKYFFKDHLHKLIYDDSLITWRLTAIYYYENNYWGINNPEMQSNLPLPLLCTFLFPFLTYPLHFSKWSFPVYLIS